jgi:carbon storage regulator CsrA
VYKRREFAQLQSRKPFARISKNLSGDWHASCFIASHHFGSAHLTTAAPKLPHIAKDCPMLVLSRKKAEQIQIGDNITITVLRIKGTAVQIGVEAPDNVKILRSELSFDPPASTVAAAAPVAVSVGAGFSAGAEHESESLVRVAVREEPQYETVRRMLPALPRTDRVTIGDTLVFLG